MIHRNRARSLSLFGAATALVIAATGLVTPAGAVDVRAPGPDGIATRAAGDCFVNYDGLRVRKQVSRLVLNGAVTDESEGPSYPTAMTGRSFAASSETKRKVTVSYHVLTLKSRPATIAFTYRKSTGALIGTEYIRSRTMDLVARTFSSPPGFYVYVGTRNGTMTRWTNSRFQDGTTRYTGRTNVLPKGSPRLDSLVYVTSAKKDGRLVHYFAATTHEGALVRITVPDKKPGQARLRTIRKTGFLGVKELSWGSCEGKRWSVPLVASDPQAETAVWTVVKAFNRTPSSSEPVPVTGADRWDFEAVL